jgi:O-antigen ligase
MLLGVVGFVLAAAFYSAMEISDRVSEAGMITDESALGRLYAWQAGFNMAVARPLTGVGFNNFVSEFLSFAPIQIPRGFTAHSIWFLVLGETGFPGLLVFIALILRCFSACRRNLQALASAQAPPVLQSTARALLAGLAGFCVSGSFLSHAYTWPLYVLAGLVSALSQYCVAIGPARSPGSAGP